LTGVSGLVRAGTSTPSRCRSSRSRWSSAARSASRSAGASCRSSAPCDC